MADTLNTNLAALTAVALAAVEAAHKAILAVNEAVDDEGHKLSTEVWADRNFQTLRVDLYYDLSNVLRTTHHLRDFQRDLVALDGEQSYADYIRAIPR